jgi:hypothetical protein
MKKQTLGLVIVGVALIIVVVMSLAFQLSVSPHNSCKMKYSAVEGMEGAPFDGVAGGEEADPTDSISWLEKEDKKKQENAKKVEGFSLHPASVGDYQPLDYFSSLKGSFDCKATGYTTNSGNLCLDDRAMQLLRTRGGNMSSGEAQIGV